MNDPFTLPRIPSGPVPYVYACETCVSSSVLNVILQLEFVITGGHGSDRKATPGVKVDVEGMNSSVNVKVQLVFFPLHPF